MAGPGEVRRGEVSLGMAGMVRQVRQGAVRPVQARWGTAGAARLVEDRRGTAWQAGHGEARLGMAGHGAARQG
jgi:hypothetical protein